MRTPHTVTLAAALFALVTACGGGESSAAGSDAMPGGDPAAGGAEDVLDQAAGEVAKQREALEEQIAGWEETLASKQGELEGMLEKLKGLSPQDVLGEEGKQLKLDTETLQKAIDELVAQIDKAKAELAKLDG